MIRRARAEDAPAIHALIHRYAGQDLLLPRPLTDIYDRIRDFWVATDRHGSVVGCVALRIWWHDLAEVRSLAVDDRASGRGYGGRLVEVYDESAGDLYEVGKILVWEPGARLIFEWRAPNYRAGQMTVVEVRFAPTQDGTRVIVEFADVTLAGPRLSLRQHGATSADWLVVGPEATATLDIRMLLSTDAGALVYVHGAGRTNANEFPRGGPIWFTPIFETADPALAWLNGVQAIARGRADGPRATFRVYAAVTAGAATAD